MKRVFSILLSLLVIFNIQASMFEERMEYGIDNLVLMAEENKLIGEGQFSRVLFANEYTHIALRPDEVLDATASIDSKHIYLTDGRIDYHFPNLMELTSDKFKKIEAGKSFFSVYNNLLEFSSEFTEVEGSDFYLKALLYDIDCHLDNNEIDFERCFNNSVVKSLNPDQPVEFTFKNQDADLFINADDATISDKQFQVAANQLDFKAKQFEVSFIDSIIRCNKNRFSSDMEGTEFINGCFEYGHLDKGSTTIRLPEQNIQVTTQNHSIKIADREFNFNVNSINFEMDQKYTVNTDRTFFRCKTGSSLTTKNEIDYTKMLIECANDMNSNVQNIHISNSDHSVNMKHFQYITENDEVSKIHAQVSGLTGNGQTYYFSIPTVRASCNSIKDFNLGMLAKDCLMDGDIHVPIIDFKDEETDTQAKIKISEATIKNNHFVVKSPEVSIKMPTITATINNLEASCKRNNDDDPLDIELLQRRCFENSLLKIPLIEVSNNKYDLKVAVRDISIDKSKLHLNIPKGSYELNKTGIYFDDLNFRCNPNVTFETFKELNINNILDNCINDTKITIKDVKNLSRFGNIKSKYKKVRFQSHQSSFLLKLKMSIMLIPTNVNFLGKISFDKANSQIILDIKRASAGILFGKKIILFFMNNFFEDKNIKVEGNKIMLKIDNFATEDK